MYKDLLEKQFMLDFNCSREELGLTFFKTSESTKNSRHFARGKANIVNYNNKLYVRTENKELTDKIKKLFKEVPAEWFFEVKHIENLSKVLKEYDLKIQNFALFFVPKSSILQQDIININKYQFFYGQDIAQFKNDSRIKMSFGYSEEDPDTLGLGYYDKNELITICGASQSGKYTWDIGIEILDESYSERGLATNLIRFLTSEIQTIAPEIIPVYATALSHTKSMNVAINAGYYIGWAELLIN